MRVMLISTALLCSAMAHGACPTSANQLKAEYQISSHSHSNEVETSDMILWRDGERVAHQYPQLEMSEGWEKVRENLIKPTRYFDHHQRAIEYQPGEKVHGQSLDDWSRVYQLLSQSQLSSMELTNRSGQKSHYRFASEGASMSLVWLDNCQLIEEMRLTVGDSVQTWTLQKVSSDTATIHGFFSARDAYQSTDFADIGDDHTDPFLTRMVNQGFIKLGSSSFHADTGKALHLHNH